MKTYIEKYTIQLRVLKNRIKLLGLKNTKSSWILGRHACLGAEVLKMFSERSRVFNIQKGRVDFLMDISRDRTLAPKVGKVVPFMERNYITPLVAREAVADGFFSHRPSLLFMDSFSELTDQLFEHREEGWRFCCNYLDVKHDDAFDRCFNTLGLMPLSEIYHNYKKFFSHFRCLYKDVPIVFLHFPVALDTREKFKERYTVINDTINMLSGEFKNLYSVQISEDVVFHSDDEEFKDFPYHYGKETYKEFYNLLASSRVMDVVSRSRKR